MTSLSSFRELVVHCFTLVKEKKITFLQPTSLWDTRHHGTHSVQTHFMNSQDTYVITRSIRFRIIGWKFSFWTKMALLKCLIWIQPPLQKNSNSNKTISTYIAASYKEKKEFRIVKHKSCCIIFLYKLQQQCVGKHYYYYSDYVYKASLTSLYVAVKLIRQFEIFVSAQTNKNKKTPHEVTVFQV